MSDDADDLRDQEEDAAIQAYWHRRGECGGYYGCHLCFIEHERASQAMSTPRDPNG